MLTYDTGGRQFRFDATGPDSGMLDRALVAALVAGDVLVTLESEIVSPVPQTGPSNAQLRVPRLDGDRGFSLHVSGQPAQGGMIATPEVGYSSDGAVPGADSSLASGHVGRRA